MGIIIKARKYLNKRVLVNLYNTFILPYLLYCIEVWGNACDSHLDPLIKMQKKIIRIITFSTYSAHSEPLFVELKILPIKKLVLQRIALQMFKFHHGTLPFVISNLFRTNDSVHEYNTRNKHSLRQPLAKREYMYKNFSFVGVYVWNYIISKTKISTTTTYGVFSSNLKQYLSHNNITYRII